MIDAARPAILGASLRCLTEENCKMRMVTPKNAITWLQCAMDIARRYLVAAQVYGRANFRQTNRGEALPPLFLRQSDPSGQARILNRHQLRHNHEQEDF